MAAQRISLVDTHTGGEPTRVVFEAPFTLDAATMLQRRELFRAQFDRYRTAIVCEPRGSDVMVGALLTPPERSSSVAGVLFFNNVGYLGMCGHGMIGVAVALQHAGRIGGGRHAIDTPVGTVQLNLLDGGRVVLQNVPSYRFRARVPLSLPQRTVHGDIAWGGNWFFICDDHGWDLQQTPRRALQDFCQEIRQHLDAQQIVGEQGQTIDHIELIGPPSDRRTADAKNFVLCPGFAYDRSPCGTGTSAKLACLAADGKLAAGDVYRQEGIVGSIFHASFAELEDGTILPTLEGTAFVNGECNLILDPADPFCMGFAS